MGHFNQVILKISNGFVREKKSLEKGRNLFIHPKKASAHLFSHEN